MDLYLLLLLVYVSTSIRHLPAFIAAPMLGAVRMVAAISVCAM
jgi:hypothetical protein